MVSKEEKSWLYIQHQKPRNEILCVRLSQSHGLLPEVSTARIQMFLKLHQVGTQANADIHS